MVQINIVVGNIDDDKVKNLRMLVVLAFSELAKEQEISCNITNCYTRQTSSKIEFGQRRCCESRFDVPGRKDQNKDFRHLVAAVAT